MYLCAYECVCLRGKYIQIMLISPTYLLYLNISFSYINIFTDFFFYSILQKLCLLLYIIMFILYIIIPWYQQK